MLAQVVGLNRDRSRTEHHRAQGMEFEGTFLPRAGAPIDYATPVIGEEYFLDTPDTVS